MASSTLKMLTSLLLYRIFKLELCILICIHDDLRMRMEDDTWTFRMSCNGLLLNLCSTFRLLYSSIFKKFTLNFDVHNVGTYLS